MSCIVVIQLALLFAQFVLKTNCKYLHKSLFESLPLFFYNFHFFHRLRKCSIKILVFNVGTLCTIRANVGNLFVEPNSKHTEVAANLKISN